MSLLKWNPTLRDLFQLWVVWKAIFRARIHQTKSIWIIRSTTFEALRKVLSLSKKVSVFILIWHLSYTWKVYPIIIVISSFYYICLDFGQHSIWEFVLFPGVPASETLLIFLLGTQNLKYYPCALLWIKYARSICYLSPIVCLGLG